MSEEALYNRKPKYGMLEVCAPDAFCFRGQATKVALERELEAEAASGR